MLTDIRISHSVSSRKRVDIIAKAKQLGVKVTNAKARVTTESWARGKTRWGHFNSYQVNKARTAIFPWLGTFFCHLRWLQARSVTVIPRLWIKNARSCIFPPCTHPLKKLHTNALFCYIPLSQYFDRTTCNDFFSLLISKSSHTKFGKNLLIRPSPYYSITL